MTLCDKGHKQVCFEDWWCPVCEARKEVGRLEREIEFLRERRGDENKVD